MSRGPGATNGSIAVHVAEQDALPVIVLVGQVSRAERGRHAFQEVDYQQFFGGMAKAVWEVADAAKLAEVMPRAVPAAVEGVPGPVVIVLPEDMLSDDVEAEVSAPWPVARPGVAASDTQAVHTMLARADARSLSPARCCARPRARPPLPPLRRPTRCRSPSRGRTRMCLTTAICSMPAILVSAIRHPTATCSPRPIW